MLCAHLCSAMPVASTPKGASHRLRVWMRAPTEDNSVICHRVWSTDEFKIGQNLDFATLGSRMIMAVPSRGPQDRRSISTRSLYRGDGINSLDDSYDADFTNDTKEAL